MPIKSVFNQQVTEIDWNQFKFGFEPSEAQKVIIEAVMLGDDNVIVNNVAGSGKTTMFVMLERLIQHYNSSMRRVYLTYSKELAKSNQSIGDSVRTVHSYAYGIMKQFLDKNSLKTLWSNPKNFNRKSFVNPDMTEDLVLKHVRSIYPGWKGDKNITKSMYKSKEYICEIIKYIHDNLIPLNYIDVLTYLDSIGRTYVTQDINDAIKIVHQCLDNFINLGVTDFDNLLYLVHVFKKDSVIRPEDYGMQLKYPYVDTCIPQLDLLCLDEVNDSFKSLRQFYKVISSDCTKTFAVGDPQQTIHIWAGAEANCFDLLKWQLNATEFVFGTSYRINKSMGRYLNSSKLDKRMSIPAWSKEGAINEQVSYNDMIFNVQPGDLVLCRFNQGRRVTYPLIKVIMDLLETGKKVTLLGNEYLELMSYMFRQCEIDNKTFVNAQLITDLENKAMEKIHEEDLSERPRQFIIDKMVDGLDVTTKFLRFFNNQFSKKRIDEFLTFCSNMLENNDKDSIVLSSIHRAKGREFKNTWLLHGEVVHNDMSKNGDEAIEAANLLLVALTRHTDTINLVEWTLPDEY